MNVFVVAIEPIMAVFVFVVASEPIMAVFVFVVGSQRHRVTSGSLDTTSLHKST